jgi:hypothetical protein
MRTTLLAGLFAVLTLVACRNHIPILDPALRTDEPTATVIGTVRGPKGMTSADDRTVEIVNVETNERRRATTDHAGGFSFKLSPGRYRVKIALRDGEALIKEPGVINITDKAVDAHADFIVGDGAGRVTRPRGPAYRIFDGLGHPIA